MNESIKALLATIAVTLLVIIPFSLSQSAEADPLPDLPTVTVTLPGQTVTVKVPQEPVTVTVRPPVPTTTVRIPGPTKTVTVTPNNPEPSGLPSARPTATVTETETETASPTGQSSTDSGTVVREPPDADPSDNTQTTETVIKRVLVGTLVTLIIAGMGIFALFFGYVLGRKDAERVSQGFYRTLWGAARRNQPKE